MGLFFEPRQPSPELVTQIAAAYQMEPPAPADLDRRARELAEPVLGMLGEPVVAKISDALRSQPRADATAKATRDANELLGGPSFNTGRFVIALLIFAALVGGGIGTDAAHMSSSSGSLFGFAGIVFGVVAAFLGSEKGSS